MTDVHPDGHRAIRKAVSWGLLAAATLLAAGTIALVWLAAVPWGPIVCPAIYPGPRNCFASNRAGTGLVVSTVVLAVYSATMLSTSLGTRRRPLLIGGVALLAVALVVAYPSVAWFPGFPLP